MNYPRPIALHDYTHLGDNFRERERIKRKKARWVQRWLSMSLLERQAILTAIAEADAAGLARFNEATSMKEKQQTQTGGHSALNRGPKKKLGFLTALLQIH